MRGSKVCFAILVIAVCRYCEALNPELAITQYVQNVWRAPQFLPHDDVTSLVQTRDGYLWVGTVEGLARFDGVRSVVFDKSNTPAIGNNWIKALMEDRAGKLWIATFGGGLVCRTEGRFIRYGAAEGLPTDIILSLYEDHRGRVWIGTYGAGVFRFQNGKFIREPGSEGTSQRAVRSILEDRKGVLWFGTDAGLYRFENGAMTILTQESGLSDNVILSLAEDAEGLWIGTENAGLNRLVNGKISLLTAKDGLTHTRIWSLAVDRDNNVWIGTDGGGLNRWSHGHLTAFTTKNGLTNDFVWAIHEDREGSLWIGTNGGGLNRLKNGRVVSLTTREGLPSDFIWAILRTRDGSLWISTEDAGLARIRDGQVTNYKATERMKTLIERKDGSLWIGGIHGLSRLSNEKIVPVDIAGLSNDTVNALAEDDNGGLWIGTNGNGLKYLKDGQLRVYTAQDGLSSKDIISLHEAKDGSLWIGTMNGLDHLVSGRITALYKSDGLPNEYVTGIFETPDGDTWATTRGGIFRMRNGHIGSVTSQQGLFDDAIMTALPGNDGGIWMGGNRGLFRAGIHELQEVIEGRRDKVSSQSFGLEDGMRSVELNGAGSATWKDADGRLWFATRGGVVSIDPSGYKPNTLAPPVVIEEVMADGHPLQGQSPYSLPPGTRRLEIHFTALSLLSPSEVELKRRLDGFDSDWVEAEQDRIAHYTNLAPGSYRFRVIAANNDGVWNQQGASIDFEIAPRFYETLWFRALVLLIFVLAGPIFYIIRLRQLGRHKEELERLVAARTAEVQAANERLAQLAREDALTGVANRRRFDEALDEEWRRAFRMHSSLALLLIDVDFFKAYNDHLGHQAGDDCLKAVAQSVSSVHKRAGELVARYGGEEFALLLPGVAGEGAISAAENVRSRIQMLAMPHLESSIAPVVTVSVGVAWIEPDTGGSAADLVGAADRALYQAKRSGRNRVESSPVNHS